MKSTGLIRRIDDLGRVVIPKEIRRTMKIREGDPFELFFDTATKMVSFQQYTPYGERDWGRAKKIADKLYSRFYAIYDRYGELQVYGGGASHSSLPSNIDFEIESSNNKLDTTKYEYREIKVCGEVIGYFMIVCEPTDTDKINSMVRTIKIIETILDEDF